MIINVAMYPKMNQTMCDLRLCPECVVIRYGDRSTFEIRNMYAEQTLNKLSHEIKDAMPKGMGFALLVFDYGENGSMFYSSSADRQDMINAMKEFISKHS